MAPESAEAPATRGEETPEESRGPEPELFSFGSTGPAARGAPSRSPRKRRGEFDDEAEDPARRSTGGIL